MILFIPLQLITSTLSGCKPSLSLSLFMYLHVNNSRNEVNPQGLISPSVISMGGIIVGAGGRDTQTGAATSSISYYNPLTYSFQSGGTLSVARGMMATATLDYWVRSP
jgi:hypothetical protein